MRYSPVQVKNPTSQHHLIRLLPEQELVVSLTRPEYRDAQVFVRSDFIVLIQDFDDQATPFRRLTFQQRIYNMPASWFLGEIVVESPILSTCMVLYSETNGQHQRPRHHKNKKELMTCPVSFNRLRCTDMETGCRHVIFDGCS